MIILIWKLLILQHKLTHLCVKFKKLIVRVLFNRQIKDDKNNELDLNISDILNFVKESVYVAQKN